MKLLLVTASVLVVVSIVSIVAAGWLLARGVGSAASLALGWARPAIAGALPADLVPAELDARLVRAVDAVRAGSVDGAAVRETLIWLPGALIDGELDAAEVATLDGKLDRVLASPPPTDAESTRGPG